MGFSISFLSDPGPGLDASEETRPGLIELGSFQERFVSSLSYWNVDDYQRHWTQAVMRIVGSSRTSCLITSMYDPAMANFIFWYPMYRVDNTVYVQNQILFLDSLSSPFDEHDPFSSVSERNVSEYGQLISEWAIEVGEMESFSLNALSNRRNAINDKPGSC